MSPAELARRCAAFRDTMRDAAHRFARKGLPGVPHQTELTIGALIAAAIDIAKETGNEEFLVRYFATQTGGTVTVDDAPIEQLVPTPNATKH